MSTRDSSREKRGAAAIDRRRSPRLEVMRRFRGELLALDFPLTVLNLSAGGFLMEAPIEFLLGGTHEFRFTPPGGTPIVLAARVLHTSATTPAGPYVVGLEFEDAHVATVRHAVASLLELLRS